MTVDGMIERHTIFWAAYAELNRLDLERITGLTPDDKRYWNLLIELCEEIREAP